MTTSFKRIIKSGLSLFSRNSLLSLATVSIMAVTLFFLTTMTVLGLLSNNLVSGLEEKVEISVYFTLDAPETQILALRDELRRMKEVDSVDYVSAEENLAIFRSEQIDNQLIIDSLEELGQNPLSAILNVKATKPEFYSMVASFIDQSKYQAVIEQVNYFEKQKALDQLTNMFVGFRRAGLGGGVLFIILSLVLAYNAVRLAVYTYRREIRVMRLVGAGNWFIRGPFLIQGVLYGVLGTLVSGLLMGLVILTLSSSVLNLIPGVDIARYVGVNFLWLVLANLVVGVLLGLLASLISVKRYLRM